jgi:hypothetical protein
MICAARATPPPREELRASAFSEPSVSLARPARALGAAARRRQGVEAGALLSLLSAVAACTVACSPTPPTGTDTTVADGGAHEAAPADGALEGATSMSGSTEAAVPISGVTTRNGYVIALSDDPASGHSGGGQAALFEVGTSPMCTLRFVGPCSVLRCDFTSATPDLGTNLSAGTISVSAGGATYSFTPAADLSYTPSGTPLTFGPGAAVTFSASGATIPAFSVGLTAPSPIVVTTPSSSSAAIIDHTAAVPIAWTTGARSAYVLVELSESLGARHVRTECLFDAAAGAASVPAEAVADFVAGTLGSGSSEGDFEVFSVDFAPVSVGGYSLYAAAGSLAFSALPTVR